MAGVTKVNPVAVATAWEQVGKEITWFNVGFAADPTASTGPEGAIQAVIAAIQLTTTIVALGPVSATIMSVGVEGVFDTAEMEGTGMEADIQALGTVDTVVLSAATVTVKTLVLA